MPRRTNQSAVYADEMRWMPLQVKDSEGAAWIKTLSKDSETGARTALIRFDPGFKQNKAVSAWPMDMYVLEGEMQCGDMHLRKESFHYRPGGVEYGPISTTEGITRLVYTSDTKERSAKEPVFVQDIGDLPWQPSYMAPEDMSMMLGAVKLLRADPIAGYTLYLHNIRRPGGDSRAGLAHMHEHSEEAFVIYGEMDDYLDDIEGHLHWRAGAYSCRPPNESLHGDGIVRVAPVMVMLRIGWVGDLPQFYDPKLTHSHDMPTAFQRRPDFFVE